MDTIDVVRDLETTRFNLHNKSTNEVEEKTSPVKILDRGDKLDDFTAVVSRSSFKKQKTMKEL